MRRLSALAPSVPVRARFRPARAIVLLVAAMLLLSPGVAGASDEPTTPPPTSSGATPSDSAPESASPEQKVSPYVKPGVVFISIEWTAWLWDSRERFYLNDGSPVTLSATCTGYVVNPEGWIATAGHCVSYKEIRADFLDAATRIAIQNEEYTSQNADLLYEHLFDYLKTESSDATGATAKPDRVVEVSWGATVSGLDVAEGKRAKVMDYQEFEEGDAALLRVDESDLNALSIVPGEQEIDDLTPVAAVGYAGSVAEVTDSSYEPSIKAGTVSSHQTVGQGLVPVYEINAEIYQE